MKTRRKERRLPAFARNLQSMKTCAAGAACLLAVCLAAACGEVRESRKEREPETRVEDKDEEFERIVREYKDYYVSYTAETDMEVSPLSEIEEEMRRYPKEIKEAKERYALSSPDAVSLVLYKHTPGHKDRYYYRTGLYDDGGG